MTLYRGDTISLTLPDFTGTTVTVALALGKGASIFFTASCDQKRFQLTFTCAFDTPRAGVQVTSIYTNSHVVMDVHGTPDDSAKILIVVNAAEGPVKPVQVQLSFAIAPLVMMSQVSFIRSVCDASSLELFQLENKKMDVLLDPSLVASLTHITPTEIDLYDRAQRTCSLLTRMLSSFRSVTGPKKCRESDHSRMWPVVQSSIADLNKFLCE